MKDVEVMRVLCAIEELVNNDDLAYGTRLLAIEELAISTRKKHKLTREQVDDFDEYE